MRQKMALGGAVAALALAGQAHALDFDFSFAYDPDLPVFGANIPGAVTGRIFGLDDNAFSSASDVEIFTHPSGVTGLPSGVFSAQQYANQLGQFINANWFEVENGQVVDGQYQIFGGYLDLNIAEQFNALVSPDQHTRVQNQLGLGGISFTAAPEPAAWALMLIGFGAMGYALRRRRPTVSA
ncbi:MAG: PEPxxWA-CTERM sorting domain-containing protein [Phenylobacterium sp.]